jgi:hypothetical protein
MVWSVASDLRSINGRPLNEMEILKIRESMLATGRIPLKL